MVLWDVLYDRSKTRMKPKYWIKTTRDWNQLLPICLVFLPLKNFRTTLVQFLYYSYLLLHIIFTFIFCKWLVCCLNGFYNPNRDDDDDGDDHDHDDDDDDHNDDDDADDEHQV